MLFQKIDSMLTAAAAKFDDITMWVQLHNMPIACMDPHIVRRIGEQIGRVKEVDSGTGDSCIGRYARVKITRSIDAPLVRCVPVAIDGGKDEVLVLVLYEKLPELFCFACGKIGHHLKSCDADEEVKANPSFGNWLRAGRGGDLRRPSQSPNTPQRNTPGGPSLAPRLRWNGPRPPPRGSILEERVIGETGGIENDCAEAESETERRGEVLVANEEGDDIVENTPDLIAKLGTSPQVALMTSKGENPIDREEQVKGSKVKAKQSMIAMRRNTKASPRKQVLTHVKAKNILTASSPEKKKCGLWKRRARSVGHDKSREELMDVDIGKKRKDPPEVKNGNEDDSKQSTTPIPTMENATSLSFMRVEEGGRAWKQLKLVDENIDNESTTAEAATQPRRAP